MKLIQCLIVCVAILISQIGWSDDEVPKLVSLNQLYGVGEEARARIVLVLHKGRVGAGTLSGARLNMYRPRGYSMNQTWNQNTAKRIAASHGLEYVADWWMSEVDLNCVVMLIPEGSDIELVIEDLLTDQEVLTAQAMSTYSTMSTAYNDPYFEIQKSASFFNLESLHGRVTGKDIRIAVIDTGVEYQHPDLDGQIIVRENFAQGISPGFSDDIHGTAVAGVIVAKSGNNAGIVGVAPDSKVSALKACWPVKPGSAQAVCNSFTLALAINRALEMNVDIINLSLSGPPDKVIAVLIQEALNRGVIVVAATDKVQGDLSFPASVYGVIAVHDGTATSASKTCCRVTAPADKIITTVPRGQYNFISGTSLGAAQVTGYIALLKELYPEFSANQIKSKLTELNTTVN